MRRLRPATAGVARLAGRQSAFTLVEVMIALALGTMLIVMAGKNLLESSRAYSSLAALFFNRTRAQVLLDRFVPELTVASFASLNPPVPVGAAAIEFRKVVDVVNGDPVLGNPWHIDLVPLESNTADGKDNDGDGLVDEGGLRVWEDVPPHGPTPGAGDQPVIICGSMAPGGLRFTRAGAVIHVELSLQASIDRGQPPQTIRLATAVKMRNP